jgi:hypothetical protein
LRLKKYDKVILIFFVAALATRTLTWYFEEQFDADLWHSNPAKRYQMADDIINNNLFIGKTEEEIVQLLGEPEIFTEDSKNYIVYKMGNAPSFKKYLGDRLVIIFEDDMVEKVVHQKENLDP